MFESCTPTVKFIFQKIEITCNDQNEFASEYDKGILTLAVKLMVFKGNYLVRSKITVITTVGQ